MSYSTPTLSKSASQTIGWPIYSNNPSREKIKTPLMTPSIKAITLSRSSTMVSTMTDRSQPPSLALVPVNPAQNGQYSFWTPPTDSGSPVDDPWGFSHDNYSSSSSSTLATSSSDDDESASETALTLVPKKVAVKFDSPPKKAITDLVVANHSVSNLSGFFTPMAAEQGGMQLLSVRSPSVHYDKVIHGARSPATTVHLVLPRSASARVGKPPLPLPLPKSAKDKLRPQAITAASAPASVQQPQQQPSRPPITESVTSPPVIGLDISLMPPTDHRDSAFSPRSSMAVKTPAKSRPNTLMPIDIPKRRSNSGPILWKPGSAPPTSPISSSRPPDHPMPAPMASTTNNTPRLDTLARSRIASTSSVSIPRPVLASTPSPAPVPTPSPQPPSASIVNERAEILRRTLSSTNVTTAHASRADASLSVRRAEDSPHSSLSSSHTLIEKALPPAPSPERSPLTSHPPPPAPEHQQHPSLAQSTIQFPTDEREAELELEPEYVVETPPLLRVVNVTEEDFVISPTSPPPPEPAVILPAPTIEVVPSSPQEPHVELAVLAESIARGLTPTAIPTIEAPEPSPKRSTPSPKHASLPVPSRPSSHFHRVSLSDGPVSPPSARGSFVPSSSSRSSGLPPLSRPWLPRKPVMPTPLQPTASLPNVQLSTQQQPLPVRQSYLPSPQGQQQQQPFSVRQSQLAMPELPPSQRNSQRNSFRPMAPLAPPNPRFAQPDTEAYSSDEDDPSKWASIPEESASRRSSRSSRYSNRNSIYQSYAVETDDEDAMVFPPPPSISLPNLRSILQSHDHIEAPVMRDGSGGKKIQFAVPNDAAEKPSQAAGGKTRRIRRRSNSTDSVVRNSREVPWGTNPIPKKSGLVTIPDPYGVKYADEGRYDAINHPELIPTDISQRYIRSDGAPKFPEYRETYSAKEKAIRAAAELEQRERILSRPPRTPATTVEFDDAAAPISVPVCLRRPRAISEGGAKLRRRSRSRDRADWAPPPTIPDQEYNQYRPMTMSPPSTSLLPSALEKVGRKFSLFRR